MPHSNILPALALLLAMGFAGCRPQASTPSEPAQGANMYLLAVGTYNLQAATDTGVYLVAFDADSLTFESVGVATGLGNPSYLAWDASGTHLYAVEEAGDASALAALRFDAADSSLTLLNRQATTGADPCFVGLSPDGRWALTAEYTGGSLTLFPIEPDGALGQPEQQKRFAWRGKGKDAGQAHIHTVRFTPDGRRLLATDLGSDCIYSFAYDAEASACPLGDSVVITVPQGNGPRHLAFAPQEPRCLYAINELSGRVSVFEPEADGGYTLLQEVVADSLDARGSGDICITPDGRSLYASTRLEGDHIAQFRIGPDGLLTKTAAIATGKHPRQLTLTPDGRYLLASCRDANRVEVYAVDSLSGTLRNTGVALTLPRPVCVSIRP